MEKIEAENHADAARAKKEAKASLKEAHGRSGDTEEKPKKRRYKL